MNTRSALEWVILVLVILDVMLLALFLILHITDARLVDPEPVVSEPRAQVVEDVTAPEDAALQPGEAEQILGFGDAAGRPSQSTLTVGDEQIDAQLVIGTFAQRGGPDFSLYIDNEAFRLTENEGRCYVAASGNAGTKLYLELTFLPNTDAASVASSLLKSYGAVSTSAGEKTEAFGGHSAVHVTGSSAETDLEAYAVSVNGGCLTAVVCVPGNGGGAVDTLRASVDTLVIG
ncbi:MAG: hypothetical protein IJ112_02290 [Oscillospiraceae bacterium]|nr:hypothetical protein [Oscillospiraceae bacterium]